MKLTEQRVDKSTEECDHFNKQNAEAIEMGLMVPFAPTPDQLIKESAERIRLDNLRQRGYKNAGDLLVEYNRDIALQKIAYDVEAKCAKTGKPAEKGFRVDYGYYCKEIKNSLIGQFKFSCSQADYIWEKAEEDRHAVFSEVFYYAEELAEFVQKFPAS